MKRSHLLWVAALIWGIPGVVITYKGITAYRAIPLYEEWWLLLITMGVLVTFYFLFCKIVDRYSHRIAALSDNVTLWRTFPLRGWILFVFMMGLGISLKFIPGVPLQFIASFYPALGVMLIFSAIRFLYNMRLCK